MNLTKKIAPYSTLVHNSIGEKDKRGIAVRWRTVKVSHQPNKQETEMKVLVTNKKAYHNYQILEKYEAGIALQGTEVKSCRTGNVSMSDSYARIYDGELWLIQTHISPYEKGNRNNHEPLRQRKLLVHKKEILKFRQATEAKGLSLIPLRMYLKKGKVKVQLGLGKGKQLHDKRETLKKKSYDREAQKLMKR